MNANIRNAIRCATDRIVAAITGQVSVDYTALLTEIKDQVISINANTDTVEALLDTSNVNTAETVTKLTAAITELQAINTNTTQQEKLLSDLLVEIRKLATVPVPMGMACVSISGGAAQTADVIALYNEEGAHLATDFAVVENGTLTFYTEADVDILNECDCNCVEC